MQTFSYVIFHIIQILLVDSKFSKVSKDRGISYF